MKYDNQYITDIAKWIYNNHDTPIEEIIYLLKKAYKNTDEIKKEYDTAFKFFKSS
tara:strand:+ start:2394 stop:2558 length:165 start_codon:yes stop_codon:yes gene_type:complete